MVLVVQEFVATRDPLIRDPLIRNPLNTNALELTFRLPITLVQG